ncbi:hypothetical protein CBER1_01153 [Cercospora berteroae]|uniref:Clr5 domain-containing protein n=1 Tax=Cercospora berteroae TaxID=357750 RepID=A0A2S6CIQ4_9PEZI|nr:hypothetical protein CBER1_01153 [Cercospora berteroae]
MAEYVSVTFEEIDGNEWVPCKCCRFNKGTDLPIPASLSDGEIERATKRFSASIFKDWTKLNAIVKRYEGTIQKRWIKKSVTQRRRILLGAWPNMSAGHRPDFKNLRSNKKRVPCLPEAYLWPYINLEDLLKRNLLLLFIKSRGRNLPDTFRLADVNAAHLGSGWDRGFDFADVFEDYCCSEHYLEDHDEDDAGMLFEDRHSPQRYGKLVKHHAISLKTSQYKYLRRSNEGLLSLELLQRTYKFLLECVKLILHDIRPTMFFLAPSAPEPTKMPGSSGLDEYPSMSTHSLEAPYRVPQMLDLKRLQMLVDSRCETSEDHIWLLKEDPGYFAASLREYREHDGETEFGCRSDWPTALNKMLTNAYLVFVFWDDIAKRLSSMASIDVQLARANDKTVRLARQDEEKWAAMHEVLTRLMMIPISMLYGGLQTSPRLRNRYRFELEDSASPASGRWILQLKATSCERRLDTLFFSIHNEHQRELHGLHGLVQEIQYMFETDTEAASLIDPWIASQFADLALVSEIKCIDALAPWFDENKATLLACRKDVAKTVDKTRVLVNKMHYGISAATSHNTILKFEPSDRDMTDYPAVAEKRPTKATVDQMVRAERKLDIFWKSFEAAVTRSAGISLTKVLKNRARTTREIHRTQPWSEVSETLVSSPSHAVHSDDQKGVVAELDGNVHHPNYLDLPIPKKEFVRTPVKSKVKTHGTPAAPDPRRILADDDLHEVAQAGAPPEKVTIPKRAFKVFTALLPSPSAAAQQRFEVPWDDLLFAFNAIGLQPVKLYGSAWAFNPVPKGEVVETDAGVQTSGKLDLQRSISFHQPKEVRKGAKIPKAMVRTFGRRLKHAYGWQVAEDIFLCG